MVAWHVAVVLVRLAVALLPGEELAARHADPRDEAIGSDLGLVGPDAHEVDDRVADVVGNPAAAQGSPSSFFVATSSAVTSAITLSFLASLASSSLVFATSSFSRLLGPSAAGVENAPARFSRAWRCHW